MTIYNGRIFEKLILFFFKNGDLKINVLIFAYNKKPLINFSLLKSCTLVYYKELIIWCET
jgi:hypothetical protein